MRLASLGEFGFIDRIAAKARQRSGLLLGIGDDTAIASLTPGMALLATADLLTEGIHFDLAWNDPVSLGRKSLAVNLSDIAAMGGIPRFALLSLAIPPELPVEFLDRFIDGFLAQADAHGVDLVGGDTSAAAGKLTINVTLLGEQLPERTVRRSGAAPDDLICVSGSLGDAALGLQLLMAGDNDNPASRRQLDPTPRTALGQALAGSCLPTAMIDISDGLVADLEHILQASNVGAELQIDDLPRSAAFCTAVPRGCAGFYDLPLAGGEDYELLFTLPPDQWQLAQKLAAGCETPLTAVGRVKAGNGMSLFKADGSQYRVTRGGHNHFPQSGQEVVSA